MTLLIEIGVEQDAILRRQIVPRRVEVRLPPPNNLIFSDSGSNAENGCTYRARIFLHPLDNFNLSKLFQPLWQLDDHVIDQMATLGSMKMILPRHGPAVLSPFLNYQG